MGVEDGQFEYLGDLYFELVDVGVGRCDYLYFPLGVGDGNPETQGPIVGLFHLIIFIESGNIGIKTRTLIIAEITICFKVMVFELESFA